MENIAGGDPGPGAIGASRILVRIPQWFGCRFDFGDCVRCDGRAIELVGCQFDKEARLDERCEQCGALFCHYTLTFFAIGGGGGGGGERRLVLPVDASEVVARRVFSDAPSCLYAQVFIEAPGNRLLVRAYSSY